MRLASESFTAALFIDPDTNALAQVCEMRRDQLNIAPDLRLQKLKRDVAAGKVLTGHDAVGLNGHHKRRRILFQEITSLPGRRHDASSRAAEWRCASFSGSFL